MEIDLSLNVKVIRSIKRVFALGDIKHLTKDAYRFVMGSSGFIAHYDINGFRSEYAELASFANALIRNEKANQWSNFTARDANYAYMMNKKLIYSRICIEARDFLNR